MGVWASVQWEPVGGPDFSRHRMGRDAGLGAMRTGASSSSPRRAAVAREALCQLKKHRDVTSRLGDALGFDRACTAP